MFRNTLALTAFTAVAMANTQTPQYNAMPSIVSTYQPVIQRVPIDDCETNTALPHNINGFGVFTGLEIYSSGSNSDKIAALTPDDCDATTAPHHDVYVQATSVHKIAARVDKIATPAPEDCDTTLPPDHAAAYKPATLVHTSIVRKMVTPTLDKSSTPAPEDCDTTTTAPNHDVYTPKTVLHKVPTATTYVRQIETQAPPMPHNDIYMPAKVVHKTPTAGAYVSNIDTQAPKATQNDVYMPATVVHKITTIVRKIVTPAPEDCETEAPHHDVYAPTIVRKIVTPAPEDCETEAPHHDIYTVPSAYVRKITTPAPEACETTTEAPISVYTPVTIETTTSVPADCTPTAIPAHNVYGEHATLPTGKATSPLYEHQVAAVNVSSGVYSAANITTECPKFSPKNSATLASTSAAVFLALLVAAATIL